MTWRRGVDVSILDEGEEAPGECVTSGCPTNPASRHFKHVAILQLVCHCCFRQPGPNWDLSKALNNRYLLLLLRIDRYPRHFGVLLIKVHLLAFVVVAIKWIIRPKTKKNLFSWSLHLNLTRNSSGGSLHLLPAENTTMCRLCSCQQPKKELLWSHKIALFRSVRWWAV